MRKSHKWEEVSHTDANCPYCRVWTEFSNTYIEGDTVQCEHCWKNFELGRQKNVD